MDFGNPEGNYLRCPDCGRTALKLVNQGVWDGRSESGEPTFGSFRFARCLKCGTTYGYLGPHTASVIMEWMTESDWKQARDALGIHDDE